MKAYKNRQEVRLSVRTLTTTSSYKELLKDVRLYDNSYYYSFWSRIKDVYNVNKSYRMVINYDNI